MNAVQLPSGNWRARAFNKYTGKCKSFTASTKKEAEKLANIYYLQETETESAELALGDAMEMYIASHEVIWELTTLREYKRYAQRYFDKYADYPISKFDSAFCQKIVNEISKNRSRSTVKTAFGLLSGVLNTYAPSRRVKVTFPKKVKKEIVIPTEEEINALLEEAKNTKLLMIIYLGAFLGLRRGEACALDMEHVNLKTREIYVEYSMAFDGKEIVKKNPKTVESKRHIIAPQLVIDAIKRYGLEPVSINSVTNDMPKLCKRAGIRHIKFHALRHYCASKMISIGCPIPDIMRYMGWENENTLKQIYMHSLNDSMVASANKWDDAVTRLSIVTPSKTKNVSSSCQVSRKKRTSNVRIEETLF